VCALTGTDPDRLKEEKERGITIDLGFAHAELGDGVVASFVDVPGHERFVRNMLAGAHGIDAAVLVVAADESVMPQTREHFHICRLLGIPRGLVALTKCDLADADAQAVAELEARELVAGSFLEGRPVVRVSARTGAGLDALRAALLDLAREAPERPADGLLRLPIDRVFSLKGFGTVVTGTLAGGELRDGEELEAVPSGRRARVRGLQVHGAAVDRARAGTRTAANLAGVEVEELGRGDVLVRPGTLPSTSILDVELTLLAGARELRDGARVRVHAASAEVLARVRLLDGDGLAPGASGLAQLRLESRAAAGRGDRLVLRSYSPPETIGGAVVLDPLAPRRSRASRASVARLRAAEGVAAAALAVIEESGAAGVAAPVLAARATVPLAGLLAVLAAEPTVALLGQEPTVAVSVAALAALREAAVAGVAGFHARQPLKPGMPREELRSRVFGAAPPAAFDRVLADLAAAGRIKVLAEAIALSTHQVTLNPGETEARRVLLDASREAGLAGVEARPLAEQSGKDVRLLERVSRVLVTEKLLDRVGEGLLVHREHLDALKQDVRRRFPPGSKLEVGAFKEMTGLSRKHVIPLLEYLDRERVTRRAGGERVVL
jgi:selenocysteine-specific elongation factor